MDSSVGSRRGAVPTSLRTETHRRFYPSKTIAKRRPMSEATRFDDTDFEENDSDNESLERSMQSLGYDTSTTLSSPEIASPKSRTPEAAQTSLPNIQFENGLVEGPSGPHLFQGSGGSRASSLYEPSTAEIDILFQRSPLQSEFAKSLNTPNQFPYSPNTPKQFQYSPNTPNQFSYTPNTLNHFSYSPNTFNEFSFSPNTLNHFPYSPNTSNQLSYSPNISKQFPARHPSPNTPRSQTVHPDVSRVTEEEILSWDPSQVTVWLRNATYDEAVIENFLINDITGIVLLDLKFEDLKELNIHSFGMRRRLMRSIDHLKATMQTQPETALEALPRVSSESSSSHGRSSPEKLTHEQLATEHYLQSQTRVIPGRTSPERRDYAMSVSPTGQILSSRVHGLKGNQITPEESVSIVGIEQVIPKPHKCSKGENCSKFRKRQKYLEQLAVESPGAVFQERDGVIVMGSPGNPDTARNLLLPNSAAPEPSVVASSDILGPHLGLGSGLLRSEVEKLPKLPKFDNVQRFLDYQHVDNMTTNLRTLPKITIPTSPATEEMTTAVTSIRSPLSLTQEGSPTAIQGRGPFSHTQNTQSLETGRQGTPSLEKADPITGVPKDPVPRFVSQSVPPSMQYQHGATTTPNTQTGTLFPPYQPDTTLSPLIRSTSYRSHSIQHLRPVNENKPLTPIEWPADLVRSPPINQHSHGDSQSSLPSVPDITQVRYMKKRKTARLLRAIKQFVNREDRTLNF